MRRPDDAGRLTLERDARTDDDVEVRMSFDAVEHTGRFVNLARLEVELSDGAQTSVVPLTQTAPGHYQGTTPIASDRSYLARVRTNDVAALARGTSLQAFLPAAPADEYRFRPPDAELLQAISRDTGGIYESDAQAVRPVPSVRAPVALWAWLLLGALVLYPVDLLLRRVRVQQQEPRRSGEADRRQGGQESS
jgi:hypothetical protein